MRRSLRCVLARCRERTSCFNTVGQLSEWFNGEYDGLLPVAADAAESSGSGVSFASLATRRVTCLTALAAVIVFIIIFYVIPLPKLISQTRVSKMGHIFFLRTFF